jgi:5-methylcytosine-specific restriction protein A
MIRTATASDFQEALHAEFHSAEARGADHIDVNAGDLHRRVGGYPGADHRMPSCCGVLLAERRPGDEVRETPPKGKGAFLTIRYRLPR